MDFRGPGKYLKVADIFAPGSPGGRGPRLTFGLRDLRTSTYAKSQGTLTVGMRTNHCLEIVQTRWLNQRTGKGCRLLWGRNPERGWSRVGRRREAEGDPHHDTSFLGSSPLTRVSAS